MSGSRPFLRTPAVTAVLASTAGTGHTGVVANLAWVLCAAGQKVLVVDRGSRAPKVNDYLMPFLVDRLEIADDLGFALLAVFHATPGAGDELPALHRFAPPDVPGRIDVVTPPDTASPEAFDSPDEEAITALGQLLAHSEYDHVLIDTPTKPSAGVLNLIASLCATAVVCFRQGVPFIVEAAELAHRLQAAAPVDIGVVPAMTMFDDMGDPSMGQRIRSAVHTAFAEFLDEGVKIVPDDGAIEIPYRAYDATEPLLAVLLDDENARGNLTGEYGRLASAVSGGRVTVVTPSSDVLRTRYRRACGQAGSSDPYTVLIVYPPRHRPWADWARVHLKRAGAHVLTLADVVDSSAPVLNQAGLVVIGPEQLPPETGGAMERVRSQCQLNELRLQVTDEEVPPEDAGSVMVVYRVSPEVLRARLLLHFGLVDPVMGDHEYEARIPDEHPEICQLPPRHVGFVGRDDDIERLRDLLIETGEARAEVVIGGPPGVGKSALALEYAYRFGHTYDVVWWLPADEPQATLMSLASLTKRLDEPISTYGTTAGLRKLEGRRFLLIYDNADDQDMIEDLDVRPPGSTGHLLVTSNSAEDPTIELASMRPPDTTRMVATVPGLSASQGEEVARAVQRLPISLQLAAQWLTVRAWTAFEAGGTTESGAAAAATDLVERLAAADGITGVVRIILDFLEETPHGRLTALLAEMCAFLSPLGVGLPLVRSAAMLSRLTSAVGQDAEHLRLNAGEIDRVLWLGARHGLFQVDWGARAELRMHRVVQLAVRDRMGDRLAAIRSRVQSVLADYAPSEVEFDLPESSARFAELQRHVFPSGAPNSRDDLVRRWLVNQVRFLYTTGSTGIHRAVLEPGRALLDFWTDTFGASDSLRCRLAGQLANIYRHLGIADKALVLDREAFALQRAELGVDDPLTLVTARGMGGDLRGLGRFADALAEDEANWQSFVQNLGDDHPHTRSAANNLALSRFLSGDAAGAFELEQDNYLRRRRLLGENAPTTWQSLGKTGIYQIELGRYREAIKVLVHAKQRLAQVRPAPDPLLVLSVQRHIAIAERRDGKPRQAKQHNRQVLTEFCARLGPRHPDTLGCRLSYAADHRVLREPSNLAVQLATEALEDFGTGLAREHPFIALCRMGLGLALLHDGDVTGAARELDVTCSILTDRLTETHPWALAAAVNHARIAVVSKGVRTARPMLERALENCLEFLGPEHPHTEVAAYNLTVISVPSAQARDQDWREIDVDIPQT